MKVDPPQAGGTLSRPQGQEYPLLPLWGDFTQSHIYLEIR